LESIEIGDSDYVEPKKHSVSIPDHDSKLTFKEIIEKLASELGYLFVPTKRTFDSKVVYSFGKASIYIDKNLLYCQKQGKWIPIGIENLLEIAQ